MKGIAMDLRECKKRVQDLSKMISVIEKKLTKAPKGNLRVAKSGKRVKFFLVTKKGDTRGKYIKKDERGMAMEIAQRDYYEKLLKEALREKRATEAYLRGMKGTRPEDVFGKLNEYRREMVEPLLLPDDEFVKRWQETKFVGNPSHPEDLIRETDRGDMVRTKVEEMIANAYYELGIPYRYEYPVKLYDGTVKYPDFVGLKMPERKEIYHEHLGMLDDEGYRRKNLIKLQDYAKTGMYLGDNLIVTFETDYVALNANDVKNMLRKCFFGEETVSRRK